MSEAVSTSPSLIIQFFELTKPYDKYISFAVVLLWIYVRSLIKAKEIEKQAKESKEQQAEGSEKKEKSFLDNYFPKAKPFEPQDVLNKEILDGPLSSEPSSYEEESKVSSDSATSKDTKSPVAKKNE